MGLLKIVFKVFTILTSMWIQSVFTLDSFDTSTPCPIYLTISPISSDSTSQFVENSYLEINWGPNCANPPDSIGLFRKDPSMSNDRPLVTLQINGQRTGNFKTNVKLGKIKFPQGWDKAEAAQHSPQYTEFACLPFYMASFIDGRLQTSNCLKIQPNWMTSMPTIYNVSFKNLFLPGTHCSGCYDPKISNRRSELLKKFGYVQNFDVWSQLVFGIRYLDFSIGFDESVNSEDSFWIINENLLIAPLLPVLKEIRSFVMLAKETVIIDFGDFPIGFYNNPNRHFALVRVLRSVLGDIAYARPSNEMLDSGDLTLNEMRQEGKHLIILYNDANAVKNSQFVWPSWRKFSTVNVQSNQLADYIRKLFSKKFENSPKNVPWVIYGIQSVDSSYVSGLHLPSARERVSTINRTFSQLLSGAWSMTANVVAFDFFLSSNLIDTAVHANQQKTINNTNYVIIHIDE